MLHTRSAVMLVIAGISGLLGACGPVSVDDVLNGLHKGASGDGVDRPAPPKPEPPKPEPPRPDPQCERSTLPPPPPDQKEGPCPSLKEKCAEPTKLFCTLDGRRAVVACTPEGFWDVVALEGELICTDPTPPVECKPIPKPDCANPKLVDRDGDGCIDYIACDGGPAPVECKPVPKLECDGAQYLDRDGDGCIDSASCPSNVEPGPIPVK